MQLSIAQKQNLLYWIYTAVVVLLTSVLYLHLNPGWRSFRHGENHYHAKEFKEAIPLFLESLENGNTTPQLSLHLAEALVAEGNFSESIPHYAAYLKEYPADKEVRRKLAQALFWKGDLEQAEKQLKVILDEQ